MEDRRLERLFDYTKFHIGLYMTVGTGLVGLIAAAGDEKSPFRHAIAHPWFLVIAALLMALAGLAGGIIASSTTQCESFQDFWTRQQGPWGFEWMAGKYWTWVEHTAFWASLALIAGSVWGGNVRQLLGL